MAKQRPYRRLRSPKLREAWWDAMEKGYADVSTLAQDFPAIMNIHAMATPAASKLKPKTHIDEKTGKKIIDESVPEQVTKIEQRLQRVYNDATPENLMKLRKFIQETDPGRQAQVRGTINWIMEEFNEFNPSTVISIYNQIVSSHEEGEDFYESFYKKLGDAAFSGKNIARVGGAYLRTKTRVTVI